MSDRVNKIGGVRILSGRLRYLVKMDPASVDTPTYRMPGVMGSSLGMSEETLSLGGMSVAA